MSKETRGFDATDWVLAFESRACIVVLGWRLGLGWLDLLLLTGATWPLIYFLCQCVRRSHG